MKMNIKIRFFVLCGLSMIAVYSCTHTSGTFISSHGSMAGRSMKDNCMDCHKTGATEGGFSVAGTVFKADTVSRNPNGTIYLYAKPQGAEGTRDTAIATIEVDGVGNFYTTHPIDLSQGVYPAVVSASGNKSFMQTVTTNGSCNSCHGVSQAHIVVN
jgi:hypothetical protein